MYDMPSGKNVDDDKVYPIGTRADIECVDGTASESTTATCMEVNDVSYEWSMDLNCRG